MTQSKVAAALIVPAAVLAAVSHLKMMEKCPSILCPILSGGPDTLHRLLLLVGIRSVRTVLSKPELERSSGVTP